MNNFDDKDIDLIKEKIKEHKYFPDEVKNWVTSEDQKSLLESLCKGIITQNSRDQFITIIGDYLKNKTSEDAHVNPTSDDVYTLMRQSLNDLTLLNGSIIKAIRGRAGGLYVIGADTQVDTTVSERTLQAVEKQNKEVDQQDKKDRDLEKHYYPLVKTWANGSGYPKCEITGGKLPGYKWENPDLIEIQYTVGEFTRTLDFGITSIEVKLRVEPYAVWQAAHYKKFSREVYIAFAKTESEIRNQDEGRVFGLAVELGIGVLALEVESEVKQFKLIQSPTQLSPDAREIDLLISGFRGLFKEVLDAAGADLKKRLEIPKVTY